MSLRLYNTLSGRKEEFQPLEPGKVKMYVCGVTVYDYCHIGHARANIVFDVIYRYLKFAGYEVNYVRNYTDVDDKIIQRANQRGISSRDLADEFIGAFDEDMAALNLEVPTHQPKATDYIDEIIAIIQRLIDRGLAYEAAGDVYYRVAKFSGYLKLSKRNMDEMLSGARIAPGEQKENPLDFALWKAAKPGEPSWESPWGNGRPGWHIECSAMSSSLLGDSFDIHGGGRDLIFPHHENEIAQSEGASGKPFVKYWLHNGFVNVNQEKMSKSLGNFFTIRDILQQYDPEVVRFFILTAHYRSPIDFSDQNLEEAKAGLTRFYTGMQTAQRVLATHPRPKKAACPEISADERETYDQIEALEDRFVEAMNDDFNTAAAIGHLFDGIRALNRLATVGRFDTCSLSLQVLEDGVALLQRLGRVLGLFASDPTLWLEGQKSSGLAGRQITAEEIEGLIAERQLARQQRNFARADQIRDELAAQGVVLLDSKDGTSWTLQSK